MKSKEKLKCTNCGKEFDKLLVSIECSDCYLKGFDKERVKLEKEVEKVIGMGILRLKELKQKFREVLK